MNRLLKAFGIGAAVEFACFVLAVLAGNCLPQKWGDRLFNALQTPAVQIVDRFSSRGFEGQAGHFLMIPFIQIVTYTIIVLVAMRLFGNTR